MITFVVICFVLMVLFYIGAVLLIIVPPVASMIEWAISSDNIIICFSGLVFSLWIVGCILQVVYHWGGYFVMRPLTRMIRRV